MQQAIVAVSGGADSLYALLSLKEQGYKVSAMHGLFLPSIAHSLDTQRTTDDVVKNITVLCAEYNIPLHIIDLSHEFEQLVIIPFLQEYAHGKTPNPCALCNAQIKFGLLRNAALKLGADYFATGHYAKLNTKAHKMESALSKGVDKAKDQSYFLSLVPSHSLQNVLFPLEMTTKAQNLSFLQQRNIAMPVPKESQEICFIPSDAYRDFMQMVAKSYDIPLGPCGSIYVLDNKNEVLLKTKHNGLWQYTEGQRRGLNVSWKEPLYVVAKDLKRNALILGNKDVATLKSCQVRQLNFFVEPNYWPDKLFARVRHGQQEVLANIKIYNDQSLRIFFNQEQNPTAPGQIAAIYDANGQVLCGGIIHTINEEN